MSEDQYFNISASIPRIAHLENNSYLYGGLPSFQTAGSNLGSLLDPPNVLKEVNLDLQQPLEESFLSDRDNIEINLEDYIEKSLSDKPSDEETSLSKESHKCQSVNNIPERSYIFSEKPESVLNLRTNEFSPSIQENVSPSYMYTSKIEQEIDSQIKYREKNLPRLKSKWSFLEKSRNQRRRKSVGKKRISSAIFLSRNWQPIDEISRPEATSA